VPLHHWLVGSLHFEKLSVTIYPMMQCHIADEWRPQLHWCKSLKTQAGKFFFSNVCILYKTYPVPYLIFASSCIGLRFHQCQKNPCKEKDTPIKVPTSCSNKKYKVLCIIHSSKILICVFEHAPFTVLEKFNSTGKIRSTAQNVNKGQL